MATFQTDEYGRLLTSPVGAHVTLEHDGRTLLGTVTGVRLLIEDGESFRVLTVRHFNGEPWPIEPWFVHVNVLEREYTE